MIEEDFWKGAGFGAVLSAVSVILIYSFADHFWYVVLELIAVGLLGFFVRNSLIQDNKQKQETIQALEKKIEIQVRQNKWLLDDQNSWKEKFEKLQEYHENTERKTRELEEKRSTILDEAEENLRARIAQFEAMEGKKNTEQQKRFEELERGLQGFA
jgi:DNA repair exonuclease SbcCD ATPase subunit